MLKTRVLATLALLILSIPFAFASASGALGVSYSQQLGIATNDLKVPENAVLMAIGDENYPVNPGDTYSLSYYDGKSFISLALQADSNCNVTIANIGTIEAQGMTYRQFKSHVESLVSSYYAYSSPQLILTGCGVFSLRICGQVSYSQYVTAWGLSRLSDLSVYAKPFASTREVRVTYKDGSVKTYDLFNALRNGVEEDNPLLVPGSTVEFVESVCTVNLTGAVKRTGYYQTLEGQSVYDLVMEYGCGLLTDSDSDCITVSNITDNSYEARTITLEEAKTTVLRDGDSVGVKSTATVLPFVTVTGAVTGDAASLTAANRFTYSFVQGETAMQLLRSIKGRLLSTSDLKGVYVLRGEKKIYIDAELALSSSEKGDFVLEMGDTVVIPFSQLTVTVTGAVNNPGTYAYVPDRNASYYINLAGGYSATAKKTVKVLDKDGNKVKDATVIAADSTIVANNNNTTANIALTASILAIVSTVLSIVLDASAVSKL